MENQQQLEQPLTAVNVTVANRRPREYLTEREIERLMTAAGDNRWGHRDATAVLIAYRQRGCDKCRWWWPRWTGLPALSPSCRACLRLGLTCGLPIFR